VLLGRPEGDDWDNVIAEMVQVMEGVRARGAERGVFKREKRRHRRGDFYVIKGGLTKGPGQKVCPQRRLLYLICCILFTSQCQKPGNLAHGKEYRRLLELIASNPAIRRIAGFQSSKSRLRTIHMHCADGIQVVWPDISPSCISTTRR
jgi:hypothetical protein